MTGLKLDNDRTFADEQVIRLAGPDQAVAACRTIDLVVRHRAAPALETGIVSTWRDVPGQPAGEPSGVSLELRRDNGALIQTISGRVPDGEPVDISFELGGDPSGLPRLHTNLLLDQAAGTEGPRPASRLRLRTEVTRRIVALKVGAADITLVTETGRVFAWPEDGRFLSQRVGQALLRLDAGKIEDLHDFAERLAAATGLAPALRGPEEIGRALLREDLGDPVKAPRYDLGAEDTAALALEQALESCVTQISGNVTAVCSGSAEGLKQMRIGLRRFRSITRVFGKYLPAERIDRLRADARDFGRVLGACRDLDVFVEETLPAIRSDGLPGEEEREALDALAAQAETRRQASRRAAVQLVNGDGDFARFGVALQALMLDAPWRHEARLRKPASRIARQALDKRLAKVIETAATLADARPDARHPLRVELKKLRYAVQAFRPLYAKDHRKPYLAAMSRLQDEFGVLNDAVVARDMALSVARTVEDGVHARLVHAGAGYVIGWTTRGLAGQGDQVLEAWRAFEAMTPFWRDQD